jgi:hypothetical protein
MVELERGAKRQDANNPGEDMDENDHRNKGGANE